MQIYCNSLTQYSRLQTREVKIGDLVLGNLHSVRVQTMTTTDTMNTMATVEQSIRCIEARRGISTHYSAIKTRSRKSYST